MILKIFQKKMFKAAILSFQTIIIQSIDKWKAAKVNIVISVTFNKTSNPIHQTESVLLCYEATHIEHDSLVTLYIGFRLIHTIDTSERVNGGLHLLSISLINLN